MFSSGCEISRSPPGDVVEALPAHSGRCWQYFDWLPVGEGPRERFLSVLRDRQTDRQLYLQYVAIQALKVYKCLVYRVSLKNVRP